MPLERQMRSQSVMALRRGRRWAADRSAARFPEFWFGWRLQTRAARATCIGTPSNSGSTARSSTRTWRSTPTPSGVREDLMSGVRSGVNGTPTFYINGARHDGGYELETLLAALERAAA
jgi:hypothetical protein